MVIINCTTNRYIPEKAHKDDAGFDLKSTINFKIAPGERVVVPTGVAAAIPRGYEIQIRPKSGLAAKHGITVLNTPGTIDCGYIGEIKVILINHGKEEIFFSEGYKIAQAVICALPDAEFKVVEHLPGTDRGENGFGSTGV